MYILVEIEIEKQLRKEEQKKWTFCPRWCYQPGQKGAFCPGCQTRDKRAPPFVPAWCFRLGNRDNKGFPTGTNQHFSSCVKNFPKLCHFPFPLFSFREMLILPHSPLKSPITTQDSWDLSFETLQNLPHAMSIRNVGFSINKRSL